MNWGICSTAGSGNASCTFPLAYYSQCYTVVNSTWLSGGTGMKNYQPNSISLTGINWGYTYTSNEGRSAVIRYLAIGN